MKRWKVILAAGMLMSSVATAGLGTAPAQALENGVARTPPMGWNSWNTFGRNINETLIRQMADAMVSSGMREVGYQYVVVDDCWFNPNRDSAGNIRPGPGRVASLSYSINSSTFTSLGPAFTLNSDWQFFTGYRFGIFNYATSALDGSVTVNRFDLTSP